MGTGQIRPFTGHSDIPRRVTDAERWTKGHSEVYLSFDCFLTGDKESEKREGLRIFSIL